MNDVRQQAILPSPCGRRWREATMPEGAFYGQEAPDEGEPRIALRCLETEFRAIARIFGGRGGRTAVRPHEGWAGRAVNNFMGFDLLSLISPSDSFSRWEKRGGTRENVTWQGEHARPCPKREQPVRCCLVSKKVRFMVKTVRPYVLGSLPSALCSQHLSRLP
jgi:hypothetical protein